MKARRLSVPLIAEHFGVERAAESIPKRWREARAGETVSVPIAAKKFNVQAATIYFAIRKGKIPCRIESVLRIRVRPKDVKAFVAQMLPWQRARGRKGMARRKELDASRLTAKKIPRPARKLVNHPGPKPTGSGDTYSTQGKEAP